MPRSLVLCFDGTGDSFDDDITNVVRFVDALEKRQPDSQLYYYQPGIGTYLQPGSSWGPLRQSVAKKLDEAVAWYLDTHIMGGYRFLVQNYKEGDKISLFGFSRGAYTARCLAGMLHKIGLLPKSNEEHISFAYQKYIDDTPAGRKAAKDFKRIFAVPAPIEFMGVWDTVASVGWTFKHLPFTDSNTIIKTFRHALALDERRIEFTPNPWHYTAKTPDAAKHDPDSGTAVKQPATTDKLDMPGTFRGWLSFPKYAFETIFKKKPVDAGGDDPEEEAEEERMMYHDGHETNVKEVWFAGCHSDVGGGSTPNNAIHTLANPSLQWMVTEILKHAPFIVFRSDAFTYDKAFDTVTKSSFVPKHLARGGIPSTWRRAAGSPAATGGHSASPSAGGATVTGTGDDIEEEGLVEEHVVVAVTQTEPVTDANAKINDQLVLKPVWLILEYMPRFQYYQDEDSVWHWRFRWNARRPREIYDTKPLIHSSVKLRENYTWQAKFVPKRGEELQIQYTD